MCCQGSTGTDTGSCACERAAPHSKRVRRLSKRVLRASERGNGTVSGARRGRGAYPARVAWPFLLPVSYQLYHAFPLPHSVSLEREEMLCMHRMQ